MKKIGLFIVLLCLLGKTRAQIHELGAFVGASNTIADVGATHPVYGNSPVYGLIYKWNITTRYAIRSSFKYSTLKSYDYYAQDLSRFSRFLTIDNNVLEFALGMEVNFFDFNLHNDDKEISPYVFAGVGYFQHEANRFIQTEDQAGTSFYTSEKYDGELVWSIPLVVGIKASISPLFIVGLETGIRYALTDNLDGSNPGGEFSGDEYKRGNLHNNDWYVFTGLTFSYTFGQIPCYCKEK